MSYNARPVLEPAHSVLTVVRFRLVGEEVAVRIVVAHGDTIVDTVSPLTEEITTLIVVDAAVHLKSLPLLTLKPRAPRGSFSLLIIEIRDGESRGGNRRS